MSAGGLAPGGFSKSDHGPDGCGRGDDGCGSNHDSPPSALFGRGNCHARGLRCSDSTGMRGLRRCGSDWLLRSRLRLSLRSLRLRRLLPRGLGLRGRRLGLVLRCYGGAGRGLRDLGERWCLRFRQRGARTIWQWSGGERGALLRDGRRDKCPERVEQGSVPRYPFS
jgi:hypothetical protein